ncbi:MAG: nodulation protein NfeD [Pseudomonadota bacterium]
MQSIGRRLPFFALLTALGALLWLAQWDAGVAQNAPPTPTTPGAGAKSGVILEIKGAIGPATAEYIERELLTAAGAGADLVVLEMDTPGGLVSSMQLINQAILGSSIPVAAYVSPSGAQSMSAGLYIMYASHVAAMAPGTATGAATPIQISQNPSPEPGERPAPRPAPQPERDAPDADDDASDDGATDENGADAAAGEEEGANEAAPEADSPPPALSNEDAVRAKAVNASAAYIRSLAEQRGRNAAWAEKAVREAASASANQALELGVIDYIAKDLDELLTKMQGRVVEVDGEETTLDVEGAALERVEPDLVTRILAFISNPNVSIIFMTIGVYGLIIEMWNPGSIFPGTLGVVSLAIGLYSFQVLPVDWLFVGLMGIGAILVVLEAFTPSFGLIGLTGLILFLTGAYFIFPSDAPGFEVSLVVLGALAVLGALFLGAILFAIARTHGRGPVIGADALKKREGVVESWDGGEGRVIVEGERWRARSRDRLEPGQRVRVTDVDGLVLVVRAA